MKQKCVLVRYSSRKRARFSLDAATGEDYHMVASLGV